MMKRHCVKAVFDKKARKCQTIGMKDRPAAPHQLAILTSAMAAFAAYGYRKTSMDDIARGAAMSRPALYLHFRNKRDIFRSLARFHFDRKAALVEAALAQPGPVAAVLAAAFAAQGGAAIKAMLTSPHGMELLDAAGSTAADIVQEGEAHLRRIYADWLGRASAAGQVRLVGPALELADTMTAALNGIKMAGTDYATYQTRVAHLAAVLGAGLTAGQGRPPQCSPAQS